MHVRNSRQRKFADRKVMFVAWNAPGAINGTKNEKAEKEHRTADNCYQNARNPNIFSVACDAQRYHKYAY